MNSQNSFADDIGKSDGTWLYHFVNTPRHECSPYVFERDCGDPSVPLADRKCLVTGIARYISELVRIDVPEPTQKVALKMLIHLMADLHQPMHISFQEDLGGNSIHLASPELSLHEVWDWKLTEDVDLSAFMAGITNTGGMKQYAGFEVSDDQDVVRWLSDIVSEISSTYTCPIAYKNELGAWIQSDDSLSGAYMWQRRGSAMALLELAGYRMAVLFRKIAAVWNMREKAAVLESTESAVPLPPPSYESANPFAHLTMDEFDFDPEEVVVSSRIAIERKKKTKKPIPSSVYNGFDLSPLVLVHDRIRSGHFFVTVFGKDVLSIGNAFSIVVNFPKNRSNKRVALYLDSDVFDSQHHLNDKAFLLAVIYHLRGVKPQVVPGPVMGPSAGFPRGNSAPVVAATQSFLQTALLCDAQFGESEMYRAPSGAEMTVVGGKFALSIPTVLRMRQKYEITQSVAAKMFNRSDLSEKELEKQYALHAVAQKCSSIVRVLPNNKVGVMYTTETSLRASNAKPGKPMRVLLFELVLANESTIPMLIDTNLIETFLTGDIQQAIIDCMKTNPASRRVEVLRSIRSSIISEVEEVSHWIMAKSRNEEYQKMEELFDNFYTYMHPTISSHVVVIEWDLVR